MSTYTPQQVSGLLAHVAPLDKDGSARRTRGWRSWRWVMELTPDRIAFVAEDDAAWTRLCREEALLRRLTGAGFGVPAVVAVAERERVQIRRRIPGISGVGAERMILGRPGRSVPAVERYREGLLLTTAGETLACDLGYAVLCLQRACPAEDALALGLPRADYVAMLDAIDQRLAAHRDLADVRAAVPALRGWFAALPDDPVLCHRDLGVHNVAVDVNGALAGIFDFDEAGVGHRLEDFKYFPSFGLDFTRAALDAYAASGGPRLALGDVGRFHVLTALEHILFVSEQSPRWPEIVRWARAALERFWHVDVSPW